MNPLTPERQQHLVDLCLRVEKEMFTGERLDIAAAVTLTLAARYLGNIIADSPELPATAFLEKQLDNFIAAVIDNADAFTRNRGPLQ